MTVINRSRDKSSRRNRRDDNVGKKKKDISSLLQGSYYVIKLNYPSNFHISYSLIKKFKKRMMCTITKRYQF